MIFVDDLKFVGQKKWPYRWTTSCHLIASTSGELLAFAKSIGLRPEWIQCQGSSKEHFDLTKRRRAAAVSAGAVELSRRELIKVIQAKRQRTVSMNRLRPNDEPFIFC